MKRKVKYNMSLYQKRYRYSGLKAEQEDVDITSLLDILVILLVFLIKNYSASPLEIDVIPNLSLVGSISKEAGQTYTLIQVNEGLDVYIGKKLVGNMKEDQFEEQFSAELVGVSRQTAAEDKEKEVNKNKANTQSVNFVIDQAVKYEHINSLMDLVSKNNFSNYKFIVKSNE